VQHAIQQTRGFWQGLFVDACLDFMMIIQLSHASGAIKVAEVVFKAQNVYHAI
jgi:hypothetical protein